MVRYIPTMSHTGVLEVYRNITTTFFSMWLPGVGPLIRPDIKRRYQRNCWQPCFNENDIKCCKDIMFIPQSVNLLAQELTHTQLIISSSKMLPVSLVTISTLSVSFFLPGKLIAKDRGTGQDELTVFLLY